ncbi:hypothetical protein HMPREF1981_03196 [Bacteroides pyogenes F0041]|uniref:Uncharacterized protein n=1 Tax=Bacteroides pyogenes F0041 TaxID=1321819 RepID=U2DIV7_9BACE|nr:hypothetical protein [Bacteroides pyogenes]ERI81432.1 hypothetical protein HMPREF1981_03196 [Bacteroides pyogenes F0041]
MKTEELFSKIQQKGYKAELVSAFTYRINKDKNYKAIHIFGTPDIELVDLVNEHNCYLVAAVLNRRIEDKWIQKVIYTILPFDLKELEFV